MTKGPSRVFVIDDRPVLRFTPSYERTLRSGSNAGRSISEIRGLLQGHRRQVSSKRHRYELTQTSVREFLRESGNFFAPLAAATAYRMMVRLWDRVNYYPSEPPGSKYIRTHELERSWRIIYHGGVYVLVNEAVDKWGRSYAEYVVGEFQTYKHETTGWPRVPDYVDEDFRAVLDEDFADEIEAIGFGE